MAMVEAQFPDIISRREFLLARRSRSGGGQPPRRSGLEPSSTQPEPPWWNRIVSRRTLLRTVSTVVGAGVGLFITDRLGLLQFIHTESEKRKKGIQLENLQFNTQTGTRFEKDKFYPVGKMSIQQQTTNYDLIFNFQQLAYIADKCGVNKVPEVFQIIISERYASLNQQGQLEQKEAEATSAGSMITLFIGLDTLFETAAKQLDQNFEVSPEKRIQAEANFNMLVLNRTIMRMLCSATMLSDLSRKGTSREEAEQAIEQTTRIADTFRDEVLNDQTDPAIIVSRFPAKFF